MSSYGGQPDGSHYGTHTSGGDEPEELVKVRFTLGPLMLKGVGADWKRAAQGRYAVRWACGRRDWNLEPGNCGESEAVAFWPAAQPGAKASFGDLGFQTFVANRIPHQDRRQTLRLSIIEYPKKEAPRGRSDKDTSQGVELTTMKLRLHNFRIGKAQSAQLVLTWGDGNAERSSVFLDIKLQLKPARAHGDTSSFAGASSVRSASNVSVRSHSMTKSTLSKRGERERERERASPPKRIDDEPPPRHVDPVSRYEEAPAARRTRRPREVRDPPPRGGGWDPGRDPRDDARGGRSPGRDSGGRRGQADGRYDRGREDRYARDGPDRYGREGAGSGSRRRQVSRRDRAAAPPPADNSPTRNADEGFCSANCCLQ